MHHYFRGTTLFSSPFFPYHSSMLVKDVMTHEVVAIGPDLPIKDVNALMEQRNIRHFPILSDERLIGIVSDRDVGRVGSAHPKAPKGVGFKDLVNRIMVSPVLSAHPLDPVEEAAKLLRQRKIGALPVLDGDALVGIVTATDLLDAFTKMSGVYGATTHLEVEVENRPGALAELLSEVAERGVNVPSVMTVKSGPEYVQLSLRAETIDGKGLARQLRSAGFAVLWLAEKP